MITDLGRCLVAGRLCDLRTEDNRPQSRCQALSALVRGCSGTQPLQQTITHCLCKLSSVYIQTNVRNTRRSGPLTSFSLASAKAVCVFILLPIASISQTVGKGVDERNLINIEFSLNDADTDHDARRASKYLDDDYLVKNHWDGKVYGKPAALEAIRREAKVKSKDIKPTVDVVNVAISGGNAVVTFNYTVVTGKETLHCRMDDTFLKRAKGWKLFRRIGTCP